MHEDVFQRIQLTSDDKKVVVVDKNFTKANVRMYSQSGKLLNDIKALGTYFKAGGSH